MYLITKIIGFIVRSSQPLDMLKIELNDICLRFIISNKSVEMYVLLKTLNDVRILNYMYPKG